ncbi:MAG: hypothetical protein M3Q36_01770 [bacterium]|nr:hypothetical protein [bacterium]
MAELLDRHPIVGPRYEDCGDVYAGRIETSHGDVRFLSMGPKDADKEFYVIGGLVSGCEYFYPARAIVRAGLGRVTMLRHSDRGGSHREILDKDADEMAESVMVLNNQGAPTSFLNHSKGTKVGLLTVPKLPGGIDVQEVFEFNPVIGTSLNSENIMRRLRSLPHISVEGAYTALRHPMRMRRTQVGSQWEVATRAGAILSETYALMFADQDIKKRDVEAVRNRHNSAGKTVIVCAYGSHDKITHAIDIEQGIEKQKIEFDALIKLDRKGFRGHLDLINNPDVVLAIVNFSGVMLEAVREADTSQISSAEGELQDDMPEGVTAVDVELKLPTNKTRRPKQLKTAA